MHVGDLDGTSAFVFGRFAWQASVVITVHEADHSPVVNATVSGSWSDGASGSSSCNTDASGQCQVSSPNLRGRTTSVTFTVEDVSHAHYSYLAGDNHDPEGDSNGTSIAVSQP